MRSYLNQWDNQLYLIGNDRKCERINNGKNWIDNCRGAWGHLSVNLGLCQGAFKGIELCYSALACVSDRRLFPQVYLFLLVTSVAINYRILS